MYHIDESQQEMLCEILKSIIFLITAAVVDYVEKKFGIHYTPSGMRDLLHRLGYEYKKPKLIPGKPDREAQEIFVEQYERFMDKKPKNEVVLFVDAVHP